MTPQQAKALRLIADTIVEAIKEADPTIGAPGGHIYAALMTAGMTLDQFNQIMAGLVRAGKLRKEGECYFAVEQKAA